MKKVSTLYLLLNLIYLLPLSAQFELVNNMEWQYELQSAAGPWDSIHRVFIAGDTVINERACKILYRENINCNYREQQEEYIYVEDQKMFYWDNFSASFVLLYDFDLEVGDSYVLESWPPPFESFELEVAAINEVTVFGQVLREYTLGGFVRPLKVIEGIGSLDNFFYFYDEVGACEPTMNVVNLKCFYHPAEGFHQFVEAECVDLLSSTNDPALLSDRFINVSPNPFRSQMTVELLPEAGQIERVSLLSTDGKLVQQQIVSALSTVTINLNSVSVPNGLYLLRVESTKGVVVKRVIKQ